VIYNGVKKEFEEAASQKVTVRPEFRVLMLASLRPYKGIYEFLELARALPQLGFDLILSDSEEEVNRWKAQLDIPDNLSVLPVQEEVIPWYKKASLIVNLAHKDKWLETFGMTVLEGMQFGLPAIVPTEGGVTELVQDGKNGFLVDYSDLTQIKELIGRMHSDSVLWEKLSQNALNRAKLFSNDAFAKEMRLVLE